MKRCEDSEKRLDFVAEQCKKYKINLKKPDTFEEFQQMLTQVMTQRGTAPSLFFEDIEQSLIETEEFIQEQVRREKDMYESFASFQEYQQVLAVAARVLAGQQGNRLEVQSVNSINAEPLQDRPDPMFDPNLVAGGVQLTHVAGTIRTDEVFTFRKLIFRATRGNALPHFEDIPTPIKDYLGNEVKKTVYVVMFQ